ncbi:amidase [Chryseolinea serpens]|nr:amidase [Chryseolinea serpens]
MKNKITRRQMILKSSAATLASMGLTSIAVAKDHTAPASESSNNLPPPDEICFMTAVDLAALLRTKKISAREVMTAHLKQIAKVNSKVNAIVTFVPEDQLMAQALAADELIAKGNTTGALHGLPIAVKDLVETKGLRTTYGSLLWKDLIPTQDALIVERQKNAGAIVIGKTNVPELGMGSQTFNPIFGPTFNPYDPSKTCGGSTGGGATALACGMTPLADGSDMGGSLRNPGSFCNVVGLRTSPGRVPLTAVKMANQTLSVQGPMARTVSDCALLLSVQAGPDVRSPLSLADDPKQFAKPLGRDFKGVKVAFIKDLGLPWEKEVIDAAHAQRKVFEDLGCIVEDNEPDMTDANECFVNFRHWQYEAQYGDLLESNSDKMNAYTKWHITEGRKLTGPYLSRLEMKRSALFRRVQQFLTQYEFLIMPVSQVLPFDVHTPYPDQIGDVKMLTYLDWMRSAYYISVAGNPALSVPCAFSKSGLPIGIQIVGRYNADLSVLQMGFAFEQATKIGKRRPAIAV